MIKLLDSSRIKAFDYLFVFVLFIYTASASQFARDFGDIRTIGNAFAVLFTIIYAIQRKVKINNAFVGTIALFAAYYLLASFSNRYLSQGFITDWIVRFYVVFVLCQALGKRFFVVAESVLCQLCVIGLLFWVVFLLAPNALRSVMETIRFSRSFTSEMDVVNIIVYTILPDYGELSSFHLFARNCGFGFEPAVFACFACFGILCNIYRTGLKLSSNGSFWVFILALFSTESTTGGLIFLSILLFWGIMNRRSKFAWLYLLLIIPIVLYVYNLSFVGDKLNDEIQSLQTVDADMDLSQGFGRLFSFQLLWQEFIHHPIFGLAGNPNTYLKSIGVTTATHNGIGTLLSQFGSIMTLLFCIMLCKSIKKIHYDLDTPYAVLLLVPMLGMMMSFSIWDGPIFMTFWMYGLFSRSE